jgi:hypothetical protein
MKRWGSGLALALIFAHGSVAGGLPTSTQAAKTRANGHCATLGEGFFAVAGSDACVRISGHISAGSGFGNDAARGGPSGLNFGPSPLIGAEAAASGDLRFDTPNGPARVYLNVGNSAISHRMIDGQ